MVLDMKVTTLREKLAFDDDATYDQSSIAGECAAIARIANSIAARVRLRRSQILKTDTAT
jgi:hypothetical protein